MWPAAKRLLFAWGAMVALTGAATLVGHAGMKTRLGAPLIAALLGLSYLKTAILLSEYLELRHAPRWSAALRFSIFLLLAAVFGLTVVAQSR